MNLSEMRTLLRQDLKDEESSNYRWTDEELDRAIQRALAELSRYCPREIATDIATTDGSREIDVASLSPRIRIDRVEFPIGHHPRSFQRFAVYRDTLTLIGDEEGNGNDARIYWLAPHILDDEQSTLSPALEGLVLLGAGGYAVMSLSQYVTQTAGIGGNQADRDLREWGVAMLELFRKTLRVYARNNKVRAGVLYTESD